MDFSTEGWEWLGDWLERRGQPGIAVAVADEDDEIAFASAGWAELRCRPIGRTTLFELGSIGKTFTAVLARQLLDLEAPVTDYLPWLEVRSMRDPITVEHLLMHTSGLIRGASMTADSRFDVWALRETEVGFAPGERFYYSNVGYRTLGYALEAVAGLDYPQLLRQRILEPFGLENTEPAITVEVRGRLAVATTACMTIARRRRTTRSFRRPGSRPERPTALSRRRRATWPRSRASYCAARRGG
jgi:D-alanyl-D-alanine carboxypeptidase